MPPTEKLDTHQKALALNLDPSKFGSFAEIGAGQEVARWFLAVGAASGTVAKTISAYDKEVSDDLYGAGVRYVSRERLEAMLESEWNQLLKQLQKTRGSQTRFSPLSIPLPHATMLGQMSLTVGWVCAFNSGRKVSQTTSCCTST
jgi:hypothetical protein